MKHLAILILLAFAGDGFAQPRPAINDKLPQVDFTITVSPDKNKLTIETQGWVGIGYKTRGGYPLTWHWHGQVMHGFYSMPDEDTLVGYSFIKVGNESRRVSDRYDIQKKKEK